jgi:hypothetical protein
MQTISESTADTATGHHGIDQLADQPLQELTDAEKELKVRVTYNGMHEKVEFHFDETMGVLRERAIKGFGNLPTPHLLSLYTTAGVEFGPDRDQQTVRESGIKNNEELLLRPSAVRGGC